MTTPTFRGSDTLPCRRLPARDYILIDPDRHAQYILQQTLISAVVDGHNMPKLVDGNDTLKTPVTRSARNKTAGGTNPIGKPATGTKMAEKQNAKGTVELPLPPAPLDENDKIITKEKRWDLGAIADALNEIHFMVRTNQHSLYA